MADGTRVAQEAKNVDEAIHMPNERNEKNAKKIEENRNSLRELGDIKDMIVAMSMKHDQMASHVYRKSHQEGSEGSRLQQPELSEHVQAGFQALGLVKLQESGIEAITKKTRTGSKPDVSLVDKPYMGSGGQVKWELSEELEDIRAKGLCFKCNEKYTRGHVCNKKQLYAMEREGEEQVQVVEGEEQEDEEQLPKEELQISLNAINGLISYKTIGVKGNVKKKLIIILIVSGSTHNFLSAEVAKITSVEMEETRPLPVLVADGTRIVSTTYAEIFNGRCKGQFFWLM